MSEIVYAVGMLVAFFWIWGKDNEYNNFHKFKKCFVFCFGSWFSIIIDVLENIKEELEKLNAKNNPSPD